MKRQVIIGIVLLFLLNQFNYYFDTFAISSENPWYFDQISIYGAWKLTNGSRDITIAVIDSGIDFSHPELQNVAWINEDEIENNSIDDDNNGYVDDINGWDFVSNDSIPGPEDDDPIHWHATFIAGIIAAPINGEGIAGVAPNVTIMDIRVLKSDNYQGTTLEGLGDAIRYAVDNGADVINLSLQYYSESEDYYDDIVYAIENNVAVVSITGNSWVSYGGGKEIMSYPGAYNEVIAVGATNYDREKADYSNYGEWTELVAPVGDEGTGIKGTYPPEGYVFGWGTSFAAPQIAGIIALMKSLNNTISVNEIRKILRETATDLGDEGKDKYFGYGLVNATAALNKLMGIEDEQIPIPSKPIYPAFIIGGISLIVATVVITLITQKKKN